MRYLFILILLGFFVVVIYSRPSQSDENIASQEEIEYEGDNGSPNEDTLGDSNFRDEDPTSQDVEENRRLLDLNKNINIHKKLAEDLGTRTNLDIPDYKPTRNREVRNEKSNEDVNANDEYQTYGKRRQYIKYIENNDANDQLEVAQHLTDRDVNNYKNNRLHNNMILDTPLNKRTVESKTEEGELLFVDNRDQRNNVDQNDYNIDESVDLNHAKQYYNQMQPDTRVMLDTNNRNNEYSYTNRDRRETKNRADLETLSNVDTGNEGLERSDNENEEMAIRRHIKSMSGDELEQLLNSLSVEKRSLLMKIIDDADVTEKPYDIINKREITKKAGAVEDSFIDSGQSESSKVQGGFSSIDFTTAFPSPTTLDSTEASKPTDIQPDTTPQANPKSQETNSESIAELNKDNENNPEKSDNNFASNSDSNNNQAEVVQNEQVTSKKQNKRETNLEDNADTVSFEDPKMLESENTKESHGDDSYFSPREEDLSQLLDDVDQSRVYDSSRIYKRDVEKQLELDSKLKSLEESFPNSDAYDSAPYSGPLIRVKRTNTERVMKKRAAAVLPNSKVGFFPYKAESDDEDADEGNEFDDDGFYDPSPNFVNNEKNADVNSQQTERDDANCKLNNIDQSKSPISDANDGTMSLGSDTDNILSSVEGVDENLMFSSGTRNKRKTDDLSENVDETNFIQSGKTSDDVMKPSLNNMKIPNYQENDAFGGLPRNYEGDLGRYKRIRRVKQSHCSEEPTST